MDDQTGCFPWFHGVHPNGHPPDARGLLVLDSSRWAYLLVLRYVGLGSVFTSRFVGAGFALSSLLYAGWGVPMGVFGNTECGGVGRQ